MIWPAFAVLVVGSALIGGALPPLSTRAVVGLAGLALVNLAWAWMAAA